MTPLPSATTKDITGKFFGGDKNRTSKVNKTTIEAEIDGSSFSFPFYEKTGVNGYHTSLGLYNMTMWETQSATD